MIKICLILPKGLPVPAVKGGAIESLMTDIIDQNENFKKMDITVVSIYDNIAEKQSKKYKYTKFIYINTKSFRYFIKSISVRVKNFFSSHNNTYNEITLDKIKKEKFDYIVVEDGAYHSFYTYLKYFKKSQMILHYHHVGDSDKLTDATYNKFLGVSQFVVDNFKKNSHIENCYVVKNGIDISKFTKLCNKKEKDELKKKLGFELDDFIIIFCGRLIKEKGVLELVKAIKTIDNPKIKLVIVGSINFGLNQTSEYLTELNNEITNSNGKIVLTGFINNKELYKYYKMADLAVVPSIWEDAAPLVTIEFMAAGTPLIITRTGGAPEYVSDRTIVIPKNEKIVDNLKLEILKLYSNKEQLLLMKKSGLTASKKFTTENFYNDFIEKIEK